MTGGAVGARIRLALVDARLAPLAGIARQALALEAERVVHKAHAQAAVETRLCGARIDGELARQARETGRTVALVGAGRAHTRAAARARIARARIRLVLAARTGVAERARARVGARAREDARAAVEADGRVALVYRHAAVDTFFRRKLSKINDKYSNEIN